MLLGLEESALQSSGMEIVLIRHGEPEWERDGLSVTNPPLTDRGRQQAERLAQAMREERFERYSCHLWSGLVKQRLHFSRLSAAMR